MKINIDRQTATLNDLKPTVQCKNQPELTHWLHYDSASPKLGIKEEGDTNHLRYGTGLLNINELQKPT